jgi:hypothetical protein
MTQIRPQLPVQENIIGNPIGAEYITVKYGKILDTDGLASFYTKSGEFRFNNIWYSICI